MELSEEKDILTVHISREGAMTVAYGFMMFCVLIATDGCSYTEK